MRRLDAGSVVSSTWRPYIEALPNLVVGTLVALVLSALTLLVMGPPTWVGLSSMCLKVWRGQRVGLSEVYSGFRKFGAAWGVAALPVLFVVVLGGGLVAVTGLSPFVGESLRAKGLAAVPGSLVMLSIAAATGLLAIPVLAPIFGLAFPAVADGLGAGEALKLSFGRGMANLGPLLHLGLLFAFAEALIGNSVGGLGRLLSWPWGWMVFARAYLALTEDETQPVLQSGAPLQPPRPEAPPSPKGPTLSPRLGHGDAHCEGERMRIADARRLRALAVAAGILWAAAAVTVAYGARQPGGLLAEHGDAHPSSYGIDAVTLGIGAVLCTVVLASGWALTRWAMVVSHDGVSLTRGRLVEWHLPWSELNCWRTEVNAESGALEAVVFFDKAGTERRIQCYDAPNALSPGLADAVRRYAPHGSEQ